MSTSGSDEIAGWYFDGATSRRVPAILEVAPDGLATLRVEDLPPHPVPRAALAASDRIGSTPRTVRLPGGGIFQTEDPAADALLAERGGSGARWIHRLESRWRVVLPTLAAVAIIGWWSIAFGLPWLARRAADRMPALVVRSFGTGMLEVLDRSLFAPTTLPVDTRARLQARFRSMDVGDFEPVEPALAFRGGRALGANALALPDGTIVLTDALVRLAESDDELVAVLAHELGHVFHRHALRQALQSSAIALLAVSLTGDTAIVSSLAASFPMLVVELHYSRELEREADRYALAYLRQHAIDPAHFTSILRRMTKADEAGDGGADGSPGFLSTHPATEERAALFGS